MKILIIGKPGVGKTTLIKRLLQNAGGFHTEGRAEKNRKGGTLIQEIPGGSRKIFDSEKDMIATIKKSSDQFVERIKSRDGVVVFELNEKVIPC